MPKFSAVVITYNEERNIKRCLDSVASIADEMLVVDSNSTDQTTAIATDCGARVITRDWPGYGEQKRFAVESAANDWVFSLDADEVVSPELAGEVQSLDFAKSGYEVPRRVWYLGRWIKHGGWYPGYVLRIFRRDKGQFNNEIVHEGVEIEGPVGKCDHDLLHYSYRDVAHHVDKINEFTTLAAEQMFAKGRRASLGKITVNPFFEFLKVHVQKGGFRDGLPGVAVSTLHAYYVFLKYLKLYELQSKSDDR